MRDNNEGRKLYSLFYTENWPEITRTINFEDEIDRIKNNLSQYFQEKCGISIKVYYENFRYFFEFNGIRYKISIHNEIEIGVYLTDPEWQIGKLEVVNDEGSGRMWLDELEVQKNYQRQGIATVMLRCALFFAPNLQVPYNIPFSYNYKYPLTGNGKRFITSCINSGILDKETNCSSSVPFDDEDYSGSDDYISLGSYSSSEDDNMEVEDDMELDKENLRFSGPS